MKSLLREMEEKFIEIEETLESESTEDLEEQNVTGALDGGAGPIRTPKAFAKKTNKKTAEQLGYKVVEALDKKYEQLIESYRDFKRVGDKKPSSHIKDSIREIAKKLQEIETIVNHTSKYKNESGVASSQYGTAAAKAMTKIAERLTRISERVRALGE
jgi:DNA-binding ferritin-like protein